MKSVLISTQPEWCELIASGKKTDEVRKTRPSSDTPFKCLIYQCKGKWTCKLLRRMGLLALAMKLEMSRGKVIGEFVCKRIVFLDAYYDANGDRHLCNAAFINSCITDDELFDYLYGKHGRKHGGWAWHISDLVIYDEPRELREFFHACDKPKGTDCAICIDRRENKCKSIIRAPQSWCYVETEGE